MLCYASLGAMLCYAMLGVTGASPADADVALHAADDASGSCSPQVSAWRCGLARAAWPRSRRLLRACRMGRHRQIRRQRQLQKPFAEPLGVALLYALPLLAGGAALVGAPPPGAAARPPRRRRCCRAAPPFGVALLDLFSPAAPAPSWWVTHKSTRPAACSACAHECHSAPTKHKDIMEQL